MAVQKQDDQHEHTFSNYVRIRDVVQKTCLRRWTIGKSGEIGSRISVLPGRHDDDDDDIYIYIYIYIYKQMMFKEVVKHYRKAPPDLEKELNSEAKMFANRLGIVDRVEKYHTKNCFITIKDHKSDFKTNPECWLINPAKTQIGRVNKIILRDICASLRRALNINQWRSTKDYIKWFEEYDKDDRCSFIKYDIREFYPSITERALDRALDLAKEYMVIPLNKVEIIKHCRKTLL